MDNLLVGVLGNRDSGKTHTWATLFGRAVRTGRAIRRLYLTDRQYVEVFLVSGSPEERDEYVGDIIGQTKPRLVLCSMQYRRGVETTVQYFLRNKYLPYVHWLNPGFCDRAAYRDSLSLVPTTQDAGGSVLIRSGKGDATGRVDEMRQYIHRWASERALLRTDSGSRVIVGV
jgi:hypothetical protein